MIKKLMCLFTLILLAQITFTGQTQDATYTDISDFKLSMRIMVDETDPLSLRVKGYLITAFRKVPDISIVKRDEDVVLQVSVHEVETILTVDGRVETFQSYIGAATPHARIPPEFIEVIDKLGDKLGGERLTQGLGTQLLTFKNSLIPVWVGQKSLPFIVMRATEAGLERECVEVVSNVNTLLHNEWEGFRSMQEERVKLRQMFK